MYGLTVMLSFAAQTTSKNIEKILDRADLLYRGTPKKYRQVPGLWNSFNDFYDILIVIIFQNF